MIQLIIMAAAIALVLTMLLSITFPEIAPELMTAVDAIVFYLGQSMDIVWLVAPRNFTLILMILAVAVQFVVYTYHFVRWIVRIVLDLN